MGSICLTLINNILTKGNKVPDTERVLGWLNWKAETSNLIHYKFCCARQCLQQTCTYTHTNTHTHTHTHVYIYIYFLVVKPTRCTNFIFGIKLYMFRTVPLSIIRSFPLYTQQWYMSYSLRAAGSGRNCISFLILLLASCITYTIAVCTVKNS